MSSSCGVPCKCGAPPDTGAKLWTNLGTISRFDPAIYTPDVWIIRTSKPLRIGSQTLVQIVRGIFEVGEDQHLLAAQLTGQIPLQAHQFGVTTVFDLADHRPDLGERFNIGFEFLTQLATIVLTRIEARQIVDH